MLCWAPGGDASEARLGVGSGPRVVRGGEQRHARVCGISMLAPSTMVAELSSRRNAVTTRPTRASTNETAAARPSASCRPCEDDARTRRGYQVAQLAIPAPEMRCGERRDV